MSQESNDIVTLLKVFDEYIYAALSEEISDNKLSSFITWLNIFESFKNRREFLNALSIYMQTMIAEKKERKTKLFPLVKECVLTQEGIHITHDYNGLKYYLHPDEEVTIQNNFLKALFVNALTKYNIKADILYDQLTTSTHQYSGTPEELKKTFGINYANSMLKSRVLKPIEKTIYNLYVAGSLPFYFKTEIEKSLVGSGCKIINITFQVTNYIVLLRLARLRINYMQFIMEKLVELFPFDYPFLEEGINSLDNQAIENIYYMIKDIQNDPDYNSLPLSTLIRYKLQRLYNISLPRFE